MNWIIDAVTSHLAHGGIVDQEAVGLLTFIASSVQKYKSRRRGGVHHCTKN